VARYFSARIAKGVWMEKRAIGFRRSARAFGVSRFRSRIRCPRKLAVATNSPLSAHWRPCSPWEQRSPIKSFSSTRSRRKILEKGSASAPAAQGAHGHLRKVASRPLIPNASIMWLIDTSSVPKPPRMTRVRSSSSSKRECVSGPENFQRYIVALSVA
jgi:hypothetical protein